MLILFCQWYYLSIGNDCKCQWNCMENSLKYFANNTNPIFVNSAFAQFPLRHATSKGFN